MVIGMCNPLLDISATVDQAFLDKYNLLKNNAILAEKEHLPIYEELFNQCEVECIAGGSGQNALKVAQRVLRKPNVTVFMGCVGKDALSERLEKSARSDGVNVKYQCCETEATGN